MPENSSKLRKMFYISNSPKKRAPKEKQPPVHHTGSALQSFLSWMSISADSMSLRTIFLKSESTALITSDWFGEDSVVSPEKGSAAYHVYVHERLIVPWN